MIHHSVSSHVGCRLDLRGVLHRAQDEAGRGSVASRGSQSLRGALATVHCGNTPQTPPPGPHTRAGRPVVGHPALFDGPQACSGVRCPALAPDLDGDQPGAAPDADLAGSGLAFGMSDTSQLLVDWLIHGGSPLQDEVWV